MECLCSDSTFSELMWLWFGSYVNVPPSTHMYCSQPKMPCTWGGVSTSPYSFLAFHRLLHNSVTVWCTFLYIFFLSLFFKCFTVQQYPPPPLWVFLKKSENNPVTVNIDPPYQKMLSFSRALSPVVCLVIESN